MRSMLLVVPLLALSPFLASCGGEDDTSSAEPLSKAEFIEQADAICADGNERGEAAGEDLGDEPSEAETVDFIAEQLESNIQQQHDDIAALGAPAGDEAEVQAILDSLQSAIDEGLEDPAALVTGDDDPFEEASELASDYGLVECA